MDNINKKTIEDIIRSCKVNKKNSIEEMRLPTNLILALCQNLNAERFKNFKLNKQHSILKNNYKQLKEG